MSTLPNRLALVVFLMITPMASTYAQSEGAHLELAGMDLRIAVRDPLTIEGDLIFENQGGAALTIRNIASGTAQSVEITKKSKFLWLFEVERPVDLIRVNANSTKELTAAEGYTIRFTNFPETYGNPGLTSMYVDLGPDNDPRWDERGQLMIIRYDKTPPSAE